MSDIVDHDDTIDIPPRALPEDVIASIRTAFNKPGIQKLEVSKGKIRVLWRGPEKDTLDFDLEPPSVDDVVRNLERLVESDTTGTPEHVVGSALRALGEQGKVVTHFVVGRRTLLWRWLNFTAFTADGLPPRRMFGVARVVPSDTAPDYQLLVLGGDSPYGELTDATAGVRIVMEAPSGPPT